MPTVVECRIYDKGGYKERSAYLGSFVMHVIGETAWVTLLTGICEEDKCSWDAELDQEMLDYARGMGAVVLRYEHKGKQVERRL